jgi:hypothetical protein
MSRRFLLIACAWVLIAASSCFAAQTDAAKSPPPDFKTLAESTRRVREVYKAELAAARTPPLQIALARRLLNSAAEEKTNTPTRYSLLLVARDIAIEAGDVDTAAEAVDCIAESFTVDALKLKLELANSLERTARAPHAKADLVRLYKTLIVQAIGAEQFEAGRKVSQAAVNFSRNTDDSGLVREIANAAQRLREAEAFYNNSKRAHVTLASNPSDAAASLLVGKYYCFYKSDWAIGLPHLARGSDPKLKTLAAKELANPQGADDQIALSDAWWAASESAPGSTRAVIGLHAAEWYRKALPQSSGLTRTRIEKRLADAMQLAGLEDELLGLMTGKLTSSENGIVVLQRGDHIKTPDSYSPPLVFRIVAQTEKHNIRFAYAASQIIFNWEANPTELRIDGGPGGGRHKRNAGQVPANTWVTFDIVVRPNQFALLVDGQLRHEIKADYSQVNEPLQIFAPDSTLKIKSVRMRQLGQ